MPHCTDGLMIVFHHHSLLCGKFDVFPCHITFMDCCMGSLVLSLVVPPVPPRYTFPNSSFDSCLAQTSNMVHASLAIPLLKNFHLSHNQMAAVRSLEGPNLGSLVRHAKFTWGSKTFSSHANCSSAVVFRGDLALDSGNVLGC